MAQFPARLMFRAEADDDIEALRGTATEFTILDVEDHFQVEVTSPEDAELLLRRMAAVTDGHRMWQTLDLAEHYTGDFMEDTEAREERVLDLLGDRRVQGEDLLDTIFRLEKEERHRE